MKVASGFSVPFLGSNFLHDLVYYAVILQASSIYDNYKT